MKESSTPLACAPNSLRQKYLDLADGRLQICATMTFTDQLLHTIGEWSKDPIEDELLFVKFREQIVNRMSTVEAFEAIGETVDVLLRQTDESNSIELMQTLIALARQSDTTEIPSKLLSKKMAIESQFSKFCGYAKNQMQELFHYYRL